MRTSRARTRRRSPRWARGRRGRGGSLGRAGTHDHRRGRSETQRGSHAAQAAEHAAARRSDVPGDANGGSVAVVVHDDSLDRLGRGGLGYDVSADGVAGCRRRSGSRDDDPGVARVSPGGSRPRTGAGHGARCCRAREGGCHRRSFARSVRALGGVRRRGLSTEMRSNNLKQLEFFDKSKRENRGGAALDVRPPSDGGCNKARDHNWQVQAPPALSAS